MKGRPAVLIGHLPPPVHGMSVATEGFAHHLERSNPAVRRNISGGTHARTISYHCRRMGRVAAAIGTLVRLRRQAASLYLTCDSGPGMIYTTSLAGVARALGYQVFLHHHSYAYVNTRSRLMALLTAVAGPRCCHLVYCERMREELAATYRRAAHVELLSAAYVLASGRTRSPSTSPGALTVGHLSNLTEAKGLGLAFQAVERARERGVDVRLLLAGPTMSAGDEAVLEDGLRRLGGAAEYRGPVFGDERERFYDGIDVFLFPSRYVHESLALVVWEAMGRGAPVVAFRCGCLNAESVGASGIVMEPDEDFVERAAGVLEGWANDPAALAAASRAASDRAERARAEALGQLEEVVQRMARAL